MFRPFSTSTNPSSYPTGRESGSCSTPGVWIWDTMRIRPRARSRNLRIEILTALGTMTSSSPRCAELCLGEDEACETTAVGWIQPTRVGEYHRCATSLLRHPCSAPAHCSNRLHAPRERDTERERDRWRRETHILSPLTSRYVMLGCICWE